MNELTKGIAKVGEISKKCMKVVWNGMVMYWDEKKNVCGQESDGDSGAVEEKERKSETQVVG